MISSISAQPGRVVDGTKKPLTDDQWLGTFMSQQAERIRAHFRLYKGGDYEYWVDSEFPYVRFLRHVEAIESYLNKFEKLVEITHFRKQRRIRIVLKSQ